MNGDLNPQRLERYLTLAWESGASPVVVLTKADLCDDVESALALVEAVTFGVPVHVTSAPTGEGFAAVRAHLGQNRTGAAVGSWPFNWYLFASPALAGGLAYVAGWDGKLTAIDLATRKPVWIWQTDASRQHLAEFSKPDGSMRLRPEGSDPFYDELVTAVTRSFSMGSLLSSPVVVDGALYIGSADGDLYALR